MPEPFYTYATALPRFASEAEAVAAAAKVSAKRPGDAVTVFLAVAEVMTTAPVVTRFGPEPEAPLPTEPVEPAPIPPIQRIYDAAGEEWGSTMDPKSWLAEYRQLRDGSPDRAALARHNLPMLELLAAHLGGKFAEELERARADMGETGETA